MNSDLESKIIEVRIKQLLSSNYFELSIRYLKYIHRYLFQGIYEFAGDFRNIDFSKHEVILNGDSVAYGSFKTLSLSLEYDLSLEKDKDYKYMNINGVINNISYFTSNIWQVHPFMEGNTRAIAVFIEKYLISLGYQVDNSLFRKRAIYFRNALVRSNYFDNDLKIKEDESFLIKFYENLLLKKNNMLNSKDLIVKELFSKNKGP